MANNNDLAYKNDNGGKNYDSDTYDCTVPMQIALQYSAGVRAVRPPHGQMYFLSCTPTNTNINPHGQMYFLFCTPSDTNTKKYTWTNVLLFLHSQK